MIKLKDSEECRLEFIHCRTKEPSSLYIAQNPMTGAWMQVHKIGKTQTAYTGTKPDALRLANSIVKKSNKLGLDCNVTIQPRTILPDI